jgi:hypothetical protein
MMNYKKLTAALIAGTLVCFTVSGCSLPWSKSTANNDTTTSVESTVTNDADITLEFDDEDFVTSWDVNNCTTIALSDQSAQISGNGANASNGEVTITTPGTYVLSGTLKDGCIHVDTADKGTVRLILNGANITSNTTAPILVTDAKKVLVTIVDGTINTINDSKRSTTESEDYSAAIYSKSDLVFNGNGSLTVNAGYKNGIKSTDDLKFVSGNVSINSTEDGMIGKDLLGIKDGTYKIQAGCDGMKTTYDTDTSKGNLILENGTYTITSNNDGIQAENVLVINNGYYTIKTGGSSSAAIMKSGDNMGMGGTMGSMKGQGRFGSTTQTTEAGDESTSDSAKGLKATKKMYISNATVNLDCKDDTIHTNGTVIINSGTITAKSGDDGVHADDVLQINGGTLDIQYCYEGLEAATINIAGGDIFIVANDDGINASSGSSTTGFNMGAMPNAQGGQNGQNTQNDQTTQSTPQLNISGGKLFVNANGDGLDSNGIMTISGGEIIVEGPTENNNAALDFDSKCSITGGTLMAFGSSGMLETPTEATNVSCIITTFTSAQTANTQYSLSDASGNTILTHTPSKAYAAAIVASADIKTDNTYTITTGQNTQTVSVTSSITGGGASGMGGGRGNAGGNMGGNAGGNAGGWSGDQSGQVPNQDQKQSGRGTWN